MSDPSPPSPSQGGAASLGAGPTGRVLVVDADYETLAALARVLRARGHQVVLAADGRAGLTRAVEVAADVVLVDQDVPVVDIRTFIAVLRDNPRTSGAHLFLMGAGEPTRIASIDARAEPLVKPLNVEEVASRVAEVFRIRKGVAHAPELEGDLSQVALFDLLQVFAANRRTGRLELSGATVAGEVWVREGRIVDAVWPGVVGDKALYRLLRMQRGQFVFVPGLLPERVRIEGSTDRLLMEAARQVDEVARLEERLPPRSALVSMAAGAAPATALGAQIAQLLDEPRSIDELLDVAGAHDDAVLREVADLLDAGLLLVFDPRGRSARLCDEDEAIALRAAASRLRRAGLEGPARIGVLSSTFQDVARFARALAHVQEFHAAVHGPVAAGLGALGPIGIIRLDGSDLDLFALPVDASLRPLWAPLLAPARVALQLTDPCAEPRAAAVLAALDVRLVRAPPGWEHPSGAAAAIRAALDHGP